MAIREFGQSLLADVRKRKDDQAKAARKRKKKSELLELGGVLIKSVGGGKLTEQFNSFQQNKEVLDTNIMITQAERTGTALDTITKGIATAGTSAPQYFLKEQVERDMEAALANNLKYNQTPQKQTDFKNAYRSTFMQNEEAIKKSELAAENYKKALEAQETFNASGTKEEAYKLGQSKLSSNPLTSFFGSEKREAEAIEAYRGSVFAQSAGKLAEFDSILKSTGGDFIEARKISKDLVLDPTAFDGLDKRVERNEIYEGESITIQGTLRYSTGLVDWDDDVSRIDVRSPQGKTKALQTGFNVTTQLRADIDDKGVVIAYDKGFEASPQTPEEYENNLKLYTELVLTNGVVTRSKEQIAGTDLWAKQVIKLVTSSDYIDSQEAREFGLANEEKLKAEIRKDNVGVDEETLKLKYLESNKLQMQIAETNALTSSLSKQKDNIRMAIYETYPILDPENIEDEVLEGVEQDDDTQLTAEVLSYTGSGSTFLAEGTDKDDTRGVRNNNWLNVKENLKKEKENPWQGKVGSDTVYLQFDTPESGVRAADKVLQSYKRENNIETIEGVISKWAPELDDNPTDQYTDFVASALEQDENAKIDLSDPQIRAELLSAMSVFESEKEVSPDEILSLIEQANTTEEIVTEEVTEEEADIKIVSSTSANDPIKTRTLLGTNIEISRGSKSVQSLRQKLDKIDTRLTGNVPSSIRKRLLEERKKVQQDFDKFEKVQLLRDPTYSPSPSKAYALRMLEEDKKTLSEQDAIDKYVKRMKGEIK